MYGLGEHIAIPLTMAPLLTLASSFIRQMFRQYSSSPPGNPTTGAGTTGPLVEEDAWADVVNPGRVEGPA